MQKPLLTVTNIVDPDDRGQDELYEFDVEGQRRTFGRDDQACDIVIWSAHNGTALARVAGEIWRWGDELWVRNLSTTHELGIATPGNPPEPPLRRRRDERARGSACSVPAPLAALSAPGGCLLKIQQRHQPPAETFTYGLPEPTVAVVPDVPERFKVLATALCEPLLRGGRLPAAYGQVLHRLGLTSLRKLRGDVEQLCRHYTGASPQLAWRVEERLRRQRDALGALPVAQRRGAIYEFDVPEAVSEAAEAKVQGLSLPDYYEVALLLVRHYRITVEDLRLLPPEAAP